MQSWSLMARALALGALAGAVAACGGGAQGVATTPGLGACEITDSAAIAEVTTVSPDVLTLAGPLPFPVAYTTDDDGRMDGGYLYCLGAEIAHRAGLAGVVFVEESFSDLMSGQAVGYDLALVDATVTPERAQVVSFAAPYAVNSTGVLVRADASMTEASMESARVGVVESSLQQSAFAAGLPNATVVAYSSPDEVASAVLDGDVDAGLLDTVLALVQATSSSGDLTVIAEYSIGGDIAPVLPKDSVNVPAVSQIIDSLRADGTLEAIRARWLSGETGDAGSPLAEWHLPG
jgi:ABC-type amino acid transport substrate-binding protein